MARPLYSLSGRKGSFVRTGSGRCPKGVLRGTAGRAAGGWRSGIVAFGINGWRREGEFALPRRGRVRVDSGRRLVGVGGFGPNLSIVVSSAPTEYMYFCINQGKNRERLLERLRATTSCSWHPYRVIEPNWRSLLLQALAHLLCNIAVCVFASPMFHSRANLSHRTQRM